MRYRIATRGSALALAQAARVADELRRITGARVDLKEVVSRGDHSGEPLDEIGGSGVFVGAVRESVRAGDADLAVHSMKDLPTGQSEGLRLAAVPPRDDARDAVCARQEPGAPRSLADLPAGARVATGSPRRAAHLRAARPDVSVCPIRGNVDTRLRKLDAGEFDAVILAAAGLKRLGLAHRITETLSASDMLPAPAQGALAIEMSSECEGPLFEVVRTLDDFPTRAAVTAERSVLAALRAGCAAPVGAHAAASAARDQLILEAAVLDPEGSAPVRVSATGYVGESEALGHQVAEQLLAAGAGRYLGERVR